MSKPKRETRKALEDRDDLIAAYMQEGMSREDATERAQQEMRDNQRGDWRRPR